MPVSSQYTTITWEEYLALQRDRDILDWVARDFDRQNRKPGQPGLRAIVGRLLDSGADLQATIEDAFANMARRPRSRPRPAGPSDHQANA